MRVNFDYEYKLFHQGASPVWGININKELEYISLLWGGIRSICPLASYQQDYITRLNDLGFDVPELTNKSAGDFFWGREVDYTTELITNSKKTSFTLAQKKNWLFPEEYLTTDAFKVPPGWVAKPIESVSGKGFIFASGKDNQHQFGTILSPWVDRVLDLSCLYRNNEMTFLLNLNDGKGVFRGAVVLPPGKLDKLLTENYKISLAEIKAYSQEIITEYIALGAQTIQIDSFIYRSSPQSYKYYPLCEVNDRKTMGELAVRLKDRLFPHTMAMVMHFDHHRHASKLSLSPQQAKFQLHLQELDDKNLESFWRSHQG